MSMSFSMSIHMGTRVMGINHWNVNRLLPFTSFSADYVRGARTASDAPP